MPASNSPAFILGITGHMDLPLEDQAELRDRLKALFQWLQAGADGSTETSALPWWPNEPGGGPTPLAGLGLDRQPLVLLTSLAPGIDTLAAQVALEEGIEVRAPLPFPSTIYPDSSTFTGAADPGTVTREFNDLLNENPDIDTFPVLTVTDLDLAIAEREAKFQGDVLDREARNRRYRAAGEFVGTYSHLLFAFFQPDNPDDASSAGSQTILEVTRTGPTAGLLPGATHFPWNDAVPVIYVPCRSLKRLAGEPGSEERAATLADESWKSFKAQFLPPLWEESCLIAESASDPGPELVAQCEAKGMATLRKAIRLRRDYFEALANEPGKPIDELAAAKKLLAYQEDDQKKLWASLSESGRCFLTKLSPLAAEQARGSQLAKKLTDRRKTLMRRLAIFTFFAAFSFHGFSHWYFADKDSLKGAPPQAEQTAGDDNVPADPDTAAHGASETSSHSPGENKKAKTPYEKLEKKVGLVFLGMTMLFIVVSALLWFAYQRTRWETLRFDARALSEGLRIQFYWLAGGNATSVAQRYMSRQKGELDWIRNAISAMSFPYQRWRDEFRALPESDRRGILQAIDREWVRGQADYYGKRGHDHEHRLHRHHYLGWALTWGGVLQVPLFFVLKAFHPDKTLFFLGTASVFAVAYVAASVVTRVRHGKAHVKGNCLERLLDRSIVAGFLPLAFAMAAIILVAVKFLPSMDLVADTKDLWVILTGSTLVAGAITIAWGEKLLLAEQSRQYLSMHDLFRNAGAYLTRRFAEWNGEVERDSYAMGSAEEDIRHTLEELGKEALDEQAEWLVLHRARPVEPFLAG